MTRGRSAKLANTIQKRIGPATTMRTGVATGAVSGGEMEVNIAGSVETYPYLSWYTPAAGDVVQILVTDATWLVLGTCAS